MKAHVLATKINSILRDNKFDRYVSGKTRGKLDFSSLAKIAYSPKVFKKREARLNKDYKVILLADASGSMENAGGDKAKHCAKSLDLISNALEETDVKYAVWSFNGDILSLKDFEEEKPKNVSELYKEHLSKRQLYECYKCMTTYGSFEIGDKSCRECSAPFRPSDRHSTWGRQRSAAYNADGLALHLALEHIQKTSGKHIIVVLSDGEADCIPGRSLHYLSKDGVTYGNFPLNKVVEKVNEAPNTTLCSIGIINRDVFRWYPKQNTEVVDDVAKIGDVLVGLIKKQIKRG